MDNLLKCASLAAVTSLSPVSLAQCEPEWQALEPITGSFVAAIEAFDDGSGPSMFAGGLFTGPAENIARWDGSVWSAVGGGVQGAGETIRSMGIFDDGSGPALYVGGSLTAAGGTPANRVARWDGEAWSALGDGVDNVVRALTAFDEDGDGPNPPALFVGGTFQTAGGQPAPNIARWDGTSWSAVGGSVDGPEGFVRALVVFDDGSGPALYMTGTFNSVGGTPVNNIARWDGSAWSALGDGIIGGAAPGVALAVWDGALYVGGELTTAGGQPASLVAGWNGVAWSPVGDGIAGTRLRALASMDDGFGPALYAAGEFPGGSIARWNGDSWQLLAGGVDGYIMDLLPATSPQAGLYVAGSFTTAGGLPASHTALWTACPRCAPDCDGSGELDLFDFLCFVNAFNAQESYANCDGDGEFTLFDFLCYVNSFNAGC